jgi:hypothetical protein
MHNPSQSSDNDEVADVESNSSPAERIEFFESGVGDVPYNVNRVVASGPPFGESGLGFSNSVESDGVRCIEKYRSSITITILIIEFQLPFHLPIPS